MTGPAGRGRPATRAGSAPSTRTPVSSAIGCRSTRWPTAWAATRAARWRRRSPCAPSTSRSTNRPSTRSSPASSWPTATSATHASADPSLRGMGTTLCAIVLLEDDEGRRRSAGSTSATPASTCSATTTSSSSATTTTWWRSSSGTARSPTTRRRSTRSATSSPGPSASTPKVLVDSNTVLPYQGDRFLLCSDGLFDELNPDQIAATMRRLADPTDVADDLVRLANDHGGRDNITCVVVDVVDDGGPGWRSLSAAPGRRAAHPSSAVPGPRRRAAPPTPSDAEFAPRTDDVYADLDRARGRHVTWRVVTFVLALLVIVGVAFGAVSWAAKRTYYVGFAGNDVAVYQGRPGGLLGIDPELEDRLDLERSRAHRSADRGRGLEPELRLAGRRQVVRQHAAHRRPRPRSRTTTTDDHHHRADDHHQPSHDDDHPMIERLRRNAELSLILLGAVITAAPTRWRRLGTTSSVPANIGPFLAVDPRPVPRRPPRRAQAGAGRRRHAAPAGRAAQRHRLRVHRPARRGPGRPAGDVDRGRHRRLHRARSRSCAGPGTSSATATRSCSSASGC